MDITILLNQMAQFFMVMCLGFILYKVGYMDDDFIKKLTKIVLQVTMPALILASVLNQIENRDLKVTGMVLGIAIAMYVILPIVGFVTVKLIRTPVSEQGLYIFMMTYSNIGFMGLPLINALYGERAVFFTAIFNLIFNISSFSFGILVINYGKGKGARINAGSRLISPGIIVPLLAVVVYVIGIKVPEIVTGAVASVGNITTPAAMLLMGGALAKLDVKKVFSGVRMYLFSFLKQLAVPVIGWVLIRNIISNEEILAITVIMLSMPVANSAVLFSTEFGADEELAAKTVFITTLMSIVTIPIVSVICLA